MYTKIHKLIYCNNSCSVLLYANFYHGPKSRKGEEKTEGIIAAFYLSTQNRISSLYALCIIMSFKIQNN